MNWAGQGLAEGLFFPCLQEQPPAPTSKDAPQFPRTDSPSACCKRLALAKRSPQAHNGMRGQEEEEEEDLVTFTPVSRYVGLEQGKGSLSPPPPLDHGSSQL